MPLTRSAYLAQLRRSFLLRVHPDRFRNRAATIQAAQASLVKALSNRLHGEDFTRWQQWAPDQEIQKLRPLSIPSEKHRYVLERRDGSLLSASIAIQGSVDSIIDSIRSALQSLGVAIPNAPSHPPSSFQRKVNNVLHDASTMGQKKVDEEDIIDDVGSGRGVFDDDDRYSIMSRRGRDLLAFLADLDQGSIQQRRVDRTDAQAVASEVRRLFQFLAVDATSLGWSSSSVAVLLRRLYALYSRHGHQFHVDSFYPVRLVFSSNGFEEPLDLHGGLLRLSPAATPIQWLESLQLITNPILDEIRLLQQNLSLRIAMLQGMLGVKLLKGHSCSNLEYFMFVERLAQEVHGMNVKSETMSNSSSSTSSMTLVPPVVKVEGSPFCRRPVVTLEGVIQLGATMEMTTVNHSVRHLLGLARERSNKNESVKNLAKDLSLQIQWEYGVQRIYRTSNRVSPNEMVDCLNRIIQLGLTTSRRQQQLKDGLAGNSLAVTATGHQCHLGDDGSIMIPHNWR